MNSKECLAWLAGAADCFPRLRVSELQASIERLTAGAPGGLWEGGVMGRAGFSPLAVRYRDGADYAGWTRRAAAEFGVPELETPHRPAAGFPWLTVVWNADAGRWESLQFLGAEGAGASGPLCRRGKGARIGVTSAALRRVAFRPKTLGDPVLEKALSEFAALHRVSDAAVSGGSTWSLRLDRGVPVPDFLRCDLSAAFTEQSSQLAFLLLDRLVVELSFVDGSLWAYFSGATRPSSAESV